MVDTCQAATLFNQVCSYSLLSQFSQKDFKSFIIGIFFWVYC